MVLSNYQSSTRACAKADHAPERLFCVPSDIFPSAPASAGATSLAPAYTGLHDILNAYQNIFWAVWSCELSIMFMSARALTEATALRPPICYPGPHEILQAYKGSKTSPAKVQSAPVVLV